MKAERLQHCWQALPCPICSSFPVPLQLKAEQLRGLAGKEANISGVIVSLELISRYLNLLAAAPYDSGSWPTPQEYNNLAHDFLVQLHFGPGSHIVMPHGDIRLPLLCWIPPRAGHISGHRLWINQSLTLQTSFLGKPYHGSKDLLAFFSSTEIH